MRKLLIYSIAVLFVLAFAACQKESTQKTNAQLLKKTTDKVGDSLYHTYFSYDNQDHLVSMIISDNQGLGEQFRMNVSYDTQGRMSAATSYNGTSSFRYDNQGRVVEKLHNTPLTSPYPGGNTYAYNIKGRLVADTTYSSWTNEVFEYKTYKYDENDNVFEAKVFRNNAGSIQAERSV